MKNSHWKHYYFFSSCPYILFNINHKILFGFQTQSILGPKGICRQNSLLQKLNSSSFLTLPRPNYTSPSQKHKGNFPEPFKLWLVQIYWLHFSLSPFTVLWAVNVGKKWGEVDGMGVGWKRIGFIPVAVYIFNLISLISNTGFILYFLLWWWVEIRERGTNFLTDKLSFPSSRSFPGSVQVVVLDITL